MGVEQRCRLRGVALAQGGDEAQVLLHRRNQDGRRDDTLLQFDQAHAQAVDAVNVRHDLIAQRVHHAVVQAPVQRLGVVQQLGVGGAGLVGARQDLLVRRLNGGQLRIAGALHKGQNRLALDHAAHLKRITDEFEVHMGDLQASLRYGFDQAAGL